MKYIIYTVLVFVYVFLAYWINNKLEIKKRDEMKDINLDKYFCKLCGHRKENHTEQGCNAIIDVTHLHGEECGCKKFRRIKK